MNPGTVLAIIGMGLIIVIFSLAIILAVQEKGKE
jgi:hypothetical protein